MLRYFHASPEVLARKGIEEELGLKVSKKKPKGKYSKRERSPPVVAPYVPKLKRTNKSLQERTVEIFDGMTLVELAKRTGEGIGVLQDILINVGENIDSEFHPLSIDIAELIAMVFPVLYSDILMKYLVCNLECKTCVHASIDL